MYQKRKTDVIQCLCDLNAIKKKNIFLYDILQSNFESFIYYKYILKKKNIKIEYLIFIN